MQDEIRCPGCQKHDMRTGERRGRLLATTQVCGNLDGEGRFEITIRCIRCKTMVTIVFGSKAILVKAA